LLKDDETWFMTIIRQFLIQKHITNTVKSELWSYLITLVYRRTMRICIWIRSTSQFIQCVLTVKWCELDARQD